MRIYLLVTMCSMLDNSKKLCAKCAKKWLAKISKYIFISISNNRLRQREREAGGRDWSDSKRGKKRSPYGNVQHANKKKTGIFFLTNIEQADASSIASVFFSLLHSNVFRPHDDNPKFVYDDNISIESGKRENVQTCERANDFFFSFFCCCCHCCTFTTSVKRCMLHVAHHLCVTCTHSMHANPFSVRPLHISFPSHSCQSTCVLGYAMPIKCTSTASIV